jgi:hypothetical protein
MTGAERFQHERDHDHSAGATYVSPSDRDRYLDNLLREIDEAGMPRAEGAAPREGKDDEQDRSDVLVAYLAVTLVAGTVGFFAGAWLL